MLSFYINTDIENSIKCYPCFICFIKKYHAPYADVQSSKFLCKMSYKVMFIYCLDQYKF